MDTPIEVKLADKWVAEKKAKETPKQDTPIEKIMFSKWSK